MAKSNLPSHVAFWSAAVTTAPWSSIVLLYSLGVSKNPEGPGQAALFWLLICTPIVLLAAAWSRTDGVLSVVGLLGPMHD